MNRRRVLYAIACSLLLGLGYFVYSVVDTVNRIPEAYAAWDTGTMLVAYMKQNDGRWPTGWEDLGSVIGEHEPMLFLRGSASTEHSEDMPANYLTRIQTMVRVDWSFRPVPGTMESPVAKLDGDPFPVVWEGAEPNEMVRSYINYRATRPDRPDVPKSNIR